MPEIIINNQTIPLTGKSNLRLTRLLSDIRSPEKKNGSFSKTITVPGTKSVNTLFGHIFDITHVVRGTGSSNFSPDFNPNKRADAIISVNGFELLKGYARLLKINTEDDAITYEVIIANNVVEFFNAIQNKKLADLDLTDLNHTLSRTNMENSWETSYIKNSVAQSFAYGEGYGYPLLDQGPMAVQKEFVMTEMYPLVAGREIVSRIFSGAGYQFNTGGFFDDATFKRIYFELLGDSLGGLTNAQLIAREFQASRETSVQTLIYGQRLIFNDDSTGDNFDSASAYNNSTGQWTCPVTGAYTIYLDCSFNLTFNTTSGTALAYLSINKNGKYFDSIGTNVVSRSTSSQTVRINSAVVQGVFQAGDIVDVSLYDIADKDLNRVASTELTQLELKTESIFTIQANQTSHTTGDTVDFGAIVNKDMTQRDFILNLGKTFNLLFDVDPDNDKRLIVETRDDYFDDDTLDWSQKIDKTKLEKTPIGELDFKNVDMSFVEGKDLANRKYLARTAENFGSLRYVVDNDFVKKTKKIDVGFSVVPTINYGSAWDAILPHVEYEDGEKDNNIRMYYYGGVLDCGRYTVKDAAQGGNSSDYDEYPFFGHVDDPNTPTIDILFGMPREVALGLEVGSTYTDNNLFNKYWRNTILEYSDPSGFILKAKFNLTALDWVTLKLSNKIFVENEVFRINKIVDYDPDERSLTTVELIRAKDLGTFTPTSKGLGRGGDQANGDGIKYPKKKIGTFTPVGKSRPDSKGDKATDKGDGGFNKMKTGNTLGSKGNIGVGDRVQFVNCSGCIVGPGGGGAVLINCTDLEIDEGGLWIENEKYSPFPDPFGVTSDTSLVTFGATVNITLTGNFFHPDSVVTISKGTLNGSPTINNQGQMVLNVTAIASSDPTGNTCDVTIDGVTFSALWTYAVNYTGTLAADYVTARGITDEDHETYLETLETALFSAGLINDDGTSNGKLDALWLFGGTQATAAGHKWNFIDAQDTDAAFRLTMYGGLTHNSNGITGNGTDAYIDTHFAASDFGGQNDGHAGIYIRNDLNPGAVLKGAYGARHSSFNGTVFFPRYNSTLYSAINSSTGSGTSNTNTTGHWVTTRGSSTKADLFRNGSLFAGSISGTSSSSQPAASIKLLAVDFNEGQFIYQHAEYNIAGAHMGGNLSSSEISDLYDALDAYYTSLGINV